jgi:hypothetical protein
VFRSLFQSSALRELSVSAKDKFSIDAIHQLFSLTHLKTMRLVLTNIPNEAVEGIPPLLDIVLLSMSN